MYCGSFRLLSYYLDQLCFDGLSFVFSVWSIYLVLDYYFVNREATISLVLSLLLFGNGEGRTDLFQGDGRNRQAVVFSGGGAKNKHDRFSRSPLTSTYSDPGVVRIDESPFGCALVARTWFSCTGDEWCRLISQWHANSKDPVGGINDGDNYRIRNSYSIGGSSSLTSSFHMDG